MRDRICEALKNRSEAGYSKRRMMVSETVRKFAAMRINLDEFLAPRVSVSSVTVSPDLENASIFVSVGPWVYDAESKKLLESLEELSHDIKASIIRGMSLKRFRNIVFK